MSTESTEIEYKIVRDVLKELHGVKVKPMLLDPTYQQKSRTMW
jgi:hypothetical protein